MDKQISKKELLYYGFLAMPLAFAGIPLYIHAPDFYAVEYGVSLTKLALILLALRFFDAIQDPLIGYLSDKYSNYRSFVMMLASITLIFSFTMLFKPIFESYLTWFAFFIFLTTTSFSILTINLNSIGAVWSKDKHQKTRIAGCRESFGLIGIIMAVIMPSILQNNIPKQEAFFYVSCLLTLLTITAIFIFNKWYKKNFKESFVENNKTTKFIENVKINNIPKQIKSFFIIYGFSILASSIPAVLVLFFIRDRLYLENYSGLFLLSYFIFGAIGIAIWNKVSKEIGKHKTWLFAMFLSVISFIWAYFLNVGDFWPYLIICAISGIAFGAEIILPASILADHVQTGNEQKNVSLHFGLLAFLAKLALALSAALTLPYLDYAGFIAGEKNDENALHALSLSYAAIPCLIKIISIILLWRKINEGNINSNNRGIYNA